MKKYSFTLWGVLCYFGVFSQEVLRLNECVTMAQKHSPQAAQLAFIKEANEVQQKILSGTYLPQSSVGGQATWQSEVTSVPISLPNFSISPPPKDQYKITLDVTQNIWDGGLNKQQKAIANASAKTDEQKVITDLYQLREQVSNLYFGAIFAKKQAEIIDLLIKDLGNKIEKVRVSANNGVATKTNVLFLEARLVELNQQFSEALKRKAAAIEGLSLLIGKPLTLDTFFENSILEGTDNQKVMRPELALFDSQKEMMAINEGLVKAKYMPKISAFATGGYGKPGLNFLANQFKTYFMGGVQMRIPLSQLYSGGQQLEIQQLKINQDKIEKLKENFLLATQVRLASQKQEIARLKELISSDKTLIEMRTKIRGTADVQLENGIITSSDYLTELNNEALAKQNLVLHETQLLQAQNAIQIISGN